MELAQSRKLSSVQQNLISLEALNATSKLPPGCREEASLFILTPYPPVCTYLWWGMDAYLCVIAITASIRWPEGSSIPWREEREREEVGRQGKGEGQLRCPHHILYGMLFLTFGPIIVVLQNSSKLSF